MPLQTLKFGDTTITQHFSAKGLSINNGTSVTFLKAGTVNIDPPSIGAGTKATVNVTISGAAVGDLVFLTPPETIETGLVYVGASVTAADTVTVALYNPTAAAIDGVSRTWRYLLLRVA